jgi:tetratricopeptide (TPR) repeat protein
VLMRGNVALNLGDLNAAGTLADQGLELALRVNTPLDLALAYSLQIATRYFRGDLAGVERHFNAGLPFFDDPSVRQLLSGAMSYAYASWAAWMMGRHDVARQRLQQFIGIENEGNQYNAGISEALAAVTLCGLADYPQAEAMSLRTLQRAEKYQLAYPAASALCTLGFARAHLGRALEGVALLRQGMAAIKEVGGRTSDFRWHLTQAQMRAGSIDDALATIQEVIRDSPYDIEAHRLRGKLLHHQGQTELAEADFRKAIEVARHIGAKGFELRAATNFAEMLTGLGRRREAGTMLAEIYGRFSEGFDTADLKEAKALLEQLSREPGGPGALRQLRD